MAIKLFSSKLKATSAFLAICCLSLLTGCSHDNEESTKPYPVTSHYLQCRQEDKEFSRNFTPGDRLTFQLAKGDEPMDNASKRVKVFPLNGYVIIACEDGNDWDYNDRLYWMPYGAERLTKASAVPPLPRPTKRQVWTYAWEDKDFGDYDMNDCVIEVQENSKDRSKLDVTLVALGGARSLWLGFDNKNAKSYRDYQPVFQEELHQVLGIAAGSLVNTGITKADPVTVTVYKPDGFDFQNCSFVLGCMFREDQQGVYDNDYYYIPIATKGQDPHGIAIPGKWQWPTEKTCVKDAYPDFTAWAQDVTKAEVWNWYKNPMTGKVITNE